MTGTETDTDSIVPRRSTSAGVRLADAWHVTCGLKLRWIAAILRTLTEMQER